ncbi:hypothetical protein SAMN02745135_00822 [Caloranaerobacter azorensis DSM 13643]|uniref:Uncharacterized protein n=1 Tax=Caloranaerobacter azorensis DSM 13643 TaxID=1121264 RepID=A0A1M5T0L3_9FIRM|nr:hypothetical protein [Caloranaerobacter azorensis]SHH44289.1 hypothetical protein SAMN02745135_00822 [Caloranaerobacter azorensis DSM 13643]
MEIKTQVINNVIRDYLINGVNSIATLDEHFVRADGMSIYGPTKGIIQNIKKEIMHIKNLIMKLF